MGKKRGESIAEAVVPSAEQHVPAVLAGRRLDVAAAKLFPEHSRTRLSAWIESGALTVNGAAAERGRDPVFEGDVLVLTVPADDAPIVLRAQNLPLNVVYADKHLAVLNKPAGLTVHPGAGEPDGTLQNALLYHFPQTKKVPRAGLIHRLDKDTTGLLVVALTAAAHTKLTEAMTARDIRREYDALVVGVMPSGGTVSAAIGRSPHSRTKMAVMDVPERGRHAVTHYRVVEKFKRHTLLSVKLETGRTHQIRVHMAHIRHPVVGDPAYGGTTVRGRDMHPDLRAALAGFRRQALHARELALAHPVTGNDMAWSAPLPADFKKLLAILRKHEGH